MNSKLFFICGPHCSGKTSILSTLMDQGIIDVRGSEIGKDLFYERKFMTSAQGPEFEFEVAQKELDRDNTFTDGDKIIGVETWHPGNISYALVRNPETMEKLIEMANQSPFINNAYGIWLRIPPNIIKERTQTFKDDPEWAADFYTKIDSHLENVLSALNLLDKTIIIDASGSFDEVVELVKDAILKVNSNNSILI